MVLSVRNKKILGFILSLMIISSIIYRVFFVQTENLYKDYKVINYSLNGISKRLLVADTPAKQEKGLMFYRKLEGVDGMVFIFPDKIYRGFWNKNTLMDLDLYWIADKKVVGKSFLPSIEKSSKITTVASPEPADTVIEIPTYKNQ